MNDISYSGDKYIAVGDSTVFYSIDGFRWKIVLANAPGELFRAIWADDKFVVVGYGCVLTSPDGLDWSTTVVEGSINDVVSLDGMIVAVGDSGRALSSSDGITWNVGSHGFTSYAITSFKGNMNGDFIVGGPWVRFRYSDNGIVWDSDIPRYANLTDSNYVRSMTVAHLPRNFDPIVAVGDSGKFSGLYQSIQPEDVQYRDFKKVISSRNRILAVGENGLIIMSDPNNNNTFDVIPSNTELSLNGAVSTELGFIVVGDSGLIISSPINK